MSNTIIFVTYFYIMDIFQLYEKGVALFHPGELGICTV